jgi:hypothetical protein
LGEPSTLFESCFAAALSFGYSLSGCSVCWASAMALFPTIATLASFRFTASAWTVWKDSGLQS